MTHHTLVELLPIDPLSDPVFKVLFAVEENKDLLKAFINAVLEYLELPKAVDVELVPPRNIRRAAEGKDSEVDVRARDVRGRVFQIEVQLDPGGPLVKRMVFGSGHLYASTLGKGDSYEELKPAISVWILRDRLPHASFNPSVARKVVSEYRYRSSSGIVFSSFPVIIVIELKNRGENAIVNSDLDKWLFFFTHGKELSLGSEVPPQIRDEVFMKAVNETKRFNDDWAKRMAYESYLDKIRWNKSLKNAEERQRKQDEAQRKQDEAQRKQDEAQRKQDELYRRETERREAEIKRKLYQAFEALVAAGKSPAEAADILGMDPADLVRRGS